MLGNQGKYPIRKPYNPTATRYAVNHNWSRRGDKHKRKAKK